MVLAKFLSSFILLPAVEEVGKSAAVEMELISNQSGFNQSCLSDNLLHNSAVDRISLGSIFRNLKYFLYLGNPYEENYQFEHEIPNYDIEVSRFNSLQSASSWIHSIILQLFPFIVGFLLLEWFTLWYQGRPIPKLADASTSASLMMNMQICRYHSPSSLLFSHILTLNLSLVAFFAAVQSTPCITTFTKTFIWWIYLGTILWCGTLPH